MIDKRNKKILILGASSSVGRRLYSRLGEELSLGTFNTHPVEGGVQFNAVEMDLDEVIVDPEEFSHAVILLAEARPNKCLADPKTSYEINVNAIKRVLTYLKAKNIKPIFTSSEYIYDGTKGNYNEEDTPNPILVYGKQKLLVEQYIKENFQKYVIFRLAKVFSETPSGSSLFANWIIELEKTDVLKCATDQKFSPIFVGDVAEAIIRVVNNDCQGVYQLCGPTANTRFELLNMLLKEYARNSSKVFKVIPCSIRDFPLSEDPPIDVSMNPSKLIRDTGIKLTGMDSVCRSIVNAHFQNLKEITSTKH